jgi:2-oxoglutarate dehydrogenase E1 component
MNNKDFFNNSFLFANNSDFIEELYETYQSNPSLLSKDWLDFFKAVENNQQYTNNSTNCSVSGNSNAFVSNMAATNSTFNGNASIAIKILDAYRNRGHLIAKLNPLNNLNPQFYTKEQAYLDYASLEIQDDNMAVDLQFNHQSTWPIKDLVGKLEEIYSGTLAIEASHIYDKVEQNWLYNYFENLDALKQSFTTDEKKSWLNDLFLLENFEHTIHLKFPGAKRFSCEGSESSIAILQNIIADSPSYNVDDIVIGMAHRGRLATLTCVMGKPFRAIFAEFAGKYQINDSMSYDVKYHQGFKSQYTTSSQKVVSLEMLPNPSHLEAVNPVLAGYVRAKQDNMGAKAQSVMGILMHGDAAFAGQGVVSESLALSKISPYATFGIIHIVTNNQIGFTANPQDTKQGFYATEVAKSIGAPIIHVNGEDIEATKCAVKLAMDYRAKFQKDIVIDVIGYRKYGHNEGDEPLYTQPLMYKVIKNKKSIATLYADKLISEKVITQKNFDDIKSTINQNLEAEFVACEKYIKPPLTFSGLWQEYCRPSSDSALKNVATGILENDIREIANKLYHCPDGFNINSKLLKLFATKHSEITEDKILDWAAAEHLAFATLLINNIPIRITGQDCGRGTFSHRQSVLYDQNNGEKYIPLNHLSKEQALYFVADSNLSEYAVLGFEYGYALFNPKSLVIWEAQFGDFANGAQIIIDQFISAADMKWAQQNGLIMLLPHGYEGQGPEHSSARMERFLQLAADNSIRICYPSTPASYFHLLRSSILLNYRRPTIIFTPKSMLRNKLAVSSTAEFIGGTHFNTIIDDSGDYTSATQIMLCTGKLYYDLFEARKLNNITNVALVRLEQLYPLDIERLQTILRQYTKAKELIWCQEEPANMGAWSYLLPYLSKIAAECKLQLRHVARSSSASTASGYVSVHNTQQELLIKQAFNIGV